MQTLNEYSQANQDDILDILKNQIDELAIPLALKNKFHAQIEDNASEIIEHNYEDMISAYQCRAYDEFKDSKFEEK